MPRPSEFLFVDPSVSDLDTILGNLRPEVEAIVLDAHKSAARQIAVALEGRRGVDAAHVIAHGAPGRVSFAAGDWSTESLEDVADDLASVGHALGPVGDLLLWSCNAGEGTRGRALVDALSRATGASVGAPTGPVGAAALGGSWELEVLSDCAPMIQPPLTAAGITQYAGICSEGPKGATGALVDNYIKVVWEETSAADTYFIVANDTGAQKVIGRFEIPPGGHKGRMFVPVDAEGSFSVAGDSGGLNARRSIGLCTRPSPTGDLSYAGATTSILGAAGTTVSSVSGPRRVGA
jgi:hypothetical protein